VIVGTYSDILRPKAQSAAVCYDAALIMAGSMVIALCAQLAVWLPFSPVPVTGQTFAVLIVGALLGSKRGAIAVVVYLLEGACGLPVFASARAGLPILLGPTGGYLLGFLPAAWVTGFLAQRGFDRKTWTTAAAMTVGTVFIYLFGVAWLAAMVGTSTAITAGLYPFVPGAVCKIILAALTLPFGWKLLKKLSPQFEGK